ncbi:MAG TPA: hypothetical protein ENK26_11685 [Gammaproteobacteria bacterium]|nr:hypothetical protein [Gammaproteobacteria bacterium]
MSEFPRLIRELQNEVNLTRQQTLSLSLAGLCDDDVGIGDPLTCHWEGLRPAKPRALTRKENGEDQSYHLSPSVASRYFSGRTYQGKDANSQIASIKKDFIKTETDGEVDKFFSYDLEQLGGFSNNASPFSNFSNLNNKMAVIYIDGNDFGAKRKTLETANDYREFDQAILSARKNFLIHLFKTWGGQEAFLNREIDAPEDRENEPHCRFELLQWGGDELLFIVPAWLGFPILRQFFQTPFEWNGKPLTHAAGMALCSIKTPISRAQALAIELAEWCKSVSRKENLYAALALESIDYPTQPLETFFEQRFHSLAQYHFPHRPFSGTAENWSQQLDSFEALKDGLPRARVIQHLLDLLEELREGGTCHPDAQHEQCFEKTANDLETILGENELNIHFDNWRTLFPAIDEVWLNSTVLKPEKIQEIRHTLPSAQRIWPWLYLVEYWDYLLTDSTLGVEKKEAQNDQ